MGSWGRWGIVIALLLGVAGCTDHQLPCEQVCADANRSCGSVDGCGCGTCGANESCSGAGQCVASNCTAKTCEGEGLACGALDDGCGHLVSCGKCAGGLTCHQGACCKPKTCQEAGVACGTADDGCGGTLSCDTCPAGQLCNASAQCAAVPDACAAGAWDGAAKGLFQRSCVGCHTHDHSSYADWSAVNRNHALIRGRIALGSMPAAPTPPLPANEKSWLLQWLDCNAPR